MMARTSTEQQRNALKTALRYAVDISGGGKVVAPRTRVNATMLSLYVASHEVERHAGVDVVLDIDLYAGEPIVTRALALAQGYDLVQSAAVTDSGPLRVADVIRVIREFRDVEVKALEVTDSADLTPRERDELLREISEAMSALFHLQRRVVGS